MAFYKKLLIIFKTSNTSININELWVKKNEIKVYLNDIL